jgi:effector-binding domain-containing protein
VSGAGVAVEEIPGGHVVCTAHKGPYPELPEAYSELFKWAEEVGCRPPGAAGPQTSASPHAAAS